MNKEAMTGTKEWNQATALSQRQRVSKTSKRRERVGRVEKRWNTSKAQKVGSERKRIDARAQLRITDSCRAIFESSTHFARAIVKTIRGVIEERANSDKLQNGQCVETRNVRKPAPGR
jgi:hypothetical protein